MSHIAQIKFQINVNPPLPPGTQVSFGTSPVPLIRFGYNMAVEVATATAFRQNTTAQPLKTTMLMAHLDTGATRTSIDSKLAQSLQLIPTGIGTFQSAGGPRTTPNYAIDLAFVNTQLKSICSLIKFSSNYLRAIFGPQRSKMYKLCMIDKH